MQAKTTPRPYVITFAHGHSYPLTSGEAQALIGSYPVVRATRNAVTLRSDGNGNAIIRPATLGGGAAFEVVR